jgi:hypothetical protein
MEENNVRLENLDDFSKQVEKSIGKIIPKRYVNFTLNGYSLYFNEKQYEISRAECCLIINDIKVDMNWQSTLKTYKPTRRENWEFYVVEFTERKKYGRKN